MKKQGILLGFILSCLAVRAMANVPSPKPLNAGYVAIFISQSSRNNFYPVLLDEKERPYLAVEKTLAQLFMLHPDCQADSCRLQLQLRGSREHYWINFKTKTMGKGAGTGTPIPSSMIRKQAGQHWLRYDFWGKWLPLHPLWELRSYSLNLIPDFTLLPEQRRQHAQMIFRQKMRQQKMAKEDQVPALTPQEKYNLQSRFRFEWNDPLSKTQSGNLAYDANLDIFQGTFNASGSSNYRRTKHFSSTYPNWTYAKHHIQSFNLLALGDIYNNRSLLIPSFGVRNGLRLEKQAQGISAGGFDYKGQTQPDTEVDIWRNGFLEKVLTTEKGGSFTFNSPLARAGDTITLRYYFRDGTEKEKIIHIAPDEATLLPQKHWDLQIFGGTDETTDSQLGHIAWRYGLLPHLSVGLHAIHFPTSHTEKQNAALLDMDWRPLNGLSLDLENLQHAQGGDYALRSDITHWNNQFIQLEVAYLEKDSPLFNISNSFLFPASTPITIRGGTSWFIRDSLQAHEATWVGEYQRSKESDVASLVWRKMLWNRFSTMLEGGALKEAQQSRQPFAKATTNINLNAKTILSFERDWINKASTTTFNLRLQGGDTRPWDFSVNATKPDRERLVLGGQFDWRVHRDVNVACNWTKNSITLQLAWTGIWTQKPGPHSWQDYGSGSVVGKVLAPPRHAGESPTPIPDALVRVGSQSARTNADGYFEVSGISTNQRLNFSLDHSSIDASLKSLNESVPMQFRPGTLIHYNPPLSWTAGLDGQVIVEDVIPESAEVIAIRLPDQKEMAHTPIEKNGFFILDQLATGHYQLKVRGMNHPPKPKEITISAEDHWVTNVQLLS